MNLRRQINKKFNNLPFHTFADDPVIFLTNPEIRQATRSVFSIIEEGVFNFSHVFQYPWLLRCDFFTCRNSTLRHSHWWYLILFPNNPWNCSWNRLISWYIAYMFRIYKTDFGNFFEFFVILVYFLKYTEKHAFYPATFF